jgi:hypothetical protein
MMTPAAVLADVIEQYSHSPNPLYGLLLVVAVWTAVAVYVTAKRAFQRRTNRR